SQSVTRETFKITRKSPPNNPQPHQENGASDATERLKIDNQVAGVNTVALTYGNCSASVRIFSVVILTMHHTKKTGGIKHPLYLNTVFLSLCVTGCHSPSRYVTTS
ncbi:TPA: hypothetical protein ACG51A_004075, partial [Escherichia coli]